MDGVESEGGGGTEKWNLDGVVKAPCMVVVDLRGEEEGMSFRGGEFFLKKISASVTQFSASG